jgi:hypothetical protein
VTTRDPHRQRALAVPDKTERVYRVHQNTLHALKELAQAFVAPGALLASAGGQPAWPRMVYELYRGQARSNGFAAAG